MCEVKGKYWVHGPKCFSLQGFLGLCLIHYSPTSKPASDRVQVSANLLSGLLQKLLSLNPSADLISHSWFLPLAVCKHLSPEQLVLRTHIVLCWHKPTDKRFNRKACLEHREKRFSRLIVPRTEAHSCAQALLLSDMTIIHLWSLFFLAESLTSLLRGQHLLSIPEVLFPTC